MIINTVEGGYIVKAIYNSRDSQVFVIANPYSSVENEEKEGIAKLLYKINELVGFEEDRFSKENLNITWDRPGRKV